VELQERALKCPQRTRLLEGSLPARSHTHR
jgi:hypothetical protein